MVTESRPRGPGVGVELEGGTVKEREDIFADDGHTDYSDDLTGTYLCPTHARSLINCAL